MAKRDDLHEKLMRDIEALRLSRIAEIYREVLDEAARKNSSTLEVLGTLIAEEADARSQRALQRRMRQAKNLQESLKSLTERLHKGTYRPMPKRQVLIPKASGKMRPIAISCFEDKLVEWITAKILGIIYEPLFCRYSFGFRPGIGAHDAVKAAYHGLKDNKRPYVVEIDLAWAWLSPIPQTNAVSTQHSYG